MYGGPLVYFLIPLTIYLMARKEMYEELFFGYFFILILSDNQSSERLEFAKSVKTIYISILSVIYFLRYKELKRENMLFVIFLPFVIFSFITMSFSINDSYFFTSVQKTLSYLLSFLILPDLISRLFSEQRVAFLKKFIFFISVILLTGILLKYFAPDFALLSGDRFRGVFGGPNGLGVFCVLFFIVFFVFINYYNEMFSKQEIIFIFSIIIFSILFSGSRNALIAVFIFYLFQRFFGLSPFLGFIVFVIFLFLSEMISSNAVLIVNSFGLSDIFRVQTIEEGSGRFIAWAFAWKQIQHDFFIGRGFAYNEFYMRQNYGLLLKLNHQGGIHNSFLTFWFDQGLIGLLFYLRSYILVFIKAAQKTKYAFPAMFAISFTAFFESWLVGSLSAFAFMGIFIFTIFSNDEILPIKNEVTLTSLEQL